MAGLPPGAVRSVFGTSNGDGPVIHAILETLAGPDPQVSPTQFHNSVHNVAAGYWSIGAGSQEPAACLGCHDFTFAAALLKAAAEAAAERAPVLLCVYDAPLPLSAGRGASDRGRFRRGVRAGAGCGSRARAGPAKCRLRPASAPEPAAVQPRAPGLRHARRSQPGGPRPAAVGSRCALGCVRCMHAALLDGRVEIDVRAMLGRTAIEALIPHQGAMCLLDEVSSGTKLRSCAARARIWPRITRCAAAGRLGAVCGIEYGLQAAALHGALTAAAESRSGPVMSRRCETSSLTPSRLDRAGVRRA